MNKDFKFSNNKENDHPKHLYSFMHYVSVKCSSTTFSVVSPIFFSLLIIPRLVSYSLQTSS